MALKLHNVSTRLMIAGWPRSTVRPVGTDPIRVDSVADLAYERIRGLVLSDELAPGSRLGPGGACGAVRDLAHPRARGIAEARRRGARGLPLQPRLPRGGPRPRGRVCGVSRCAGHPGAGHRQARGGAADGQRLEGTQAPPSPARSGRGAASRRTTPAAIFTWRSRERPATTSWCGRSSPCGSSRWDDGSSRVAARSLTGRRRTSRSIARISAAVAEGRVEEAERLMAEHVRKAMQHWEPELRESEHQPEAVPRVG